MRSAPAHVWYFVAPVYQRNYKEIAGLSLEELVLCSAAFHLLSQHFRHAASPGGLEVKGTCRQDVGVTGHKLNSQKCVCMGGRCLLPTRTCELEPSYTLIEEGLWKSLYSTQIHVCSGPTISHAFLTTSPST